MSMIGNPIISTDFPKDTFSGTGSATAFTMSIAPASVNAVIVIVSGVVQEPSTYTISGTTLTFSGAPPAGTNNISVRHLGVAGIPNTPTAGSVTNSSFANTLTAIPFASGQSIGAGNSSLMKNRIINGAMVIDQRNAGASVTPSVLYSTYTLDRWNTVYSVGSKFSVQQNAGSVTPPAGFKNYLGVTSLSAYTPTGTEQYTLKQAIEGFNFVDLDFGTVNAKTVTISFRVRSSLTGTFGCVLSNSNATRNYPFTYTISAANTWETKTVTIAGDTTGTWLTTNGIGAELLFSLGASGTYLGTAGAWSSSGLTGVTGQTNIVSTSGATFYLTGVQLEVGSSATGFEYRQYGQELALCQRYYSKMTASGAYTSYGSGQWFGASNFNGYIKYPTTMRTAPTISYGGTLGVSIDGGSIINITSVGTVYAGSDSALWQPSGLSSSATGKAGIFISNNDASTFVSFASEL